MTAPHPHAAIHQDQFLKVMSREDAIATFEVALKPHPLSAENVAIENIAGRVLAADIAAPVDTPPFDRSVVDGFALRADDVMAASSARPVRLLLNREMIAAGVAPTIEVATGTATPIATGGPVPRGADAVIMIEQTDGDGDGAIVVTRPVSPGQNIAFAGSDIARGQTLLRRGVVIGAREIGMLAAVGLGHASVWRKPRVAVISTGDELVQPGGALAPAQIYDSNGPIVAAALEENGCIAVRFGAIRDEPEALRAALRHAHAQ
ncbi:MAG: molybdopterin-binding protein, partial [Beijerinckiaceae bacterium]